MRKHKAVTEEELQQFGEGVEKIRTAIKEIETHGFFGELRVFACGDQHLMLVNNDARFSISIVGYIPGSMEDRPVNANMSPELPELLNEGQEMAAKDGWTVVTTNCTIMEEDWHQPRRRGIKKWPKPGRKLTMSLTVALWRRKASNK